MKQIFVLLFCTLIVLTQNKLIYLAQIFRHGARYPINDLYDANQTKDNQGQLNSVGLRQVYLLGGYIKHDYITDMQFISPKYDPTVIQVMSSTVDRTVNSALGYLYGMFPTGMGWQIPEQVSLDRLQPPFNYQNSQNDKQATQGPQFALDLGFQPFPSTQIDDILVDCPKYGVLISRRYTELSKNLTQFQAQNTLLVSKMKLVFNLSILQVTIQTMSDLYDTLISDLTLGRPIPKEVDQSDMKQLKYISDYYNSLVINGNISQLLSTPLISLIQSKMQQNIQKKNLKKWSIIVGNDLNLMSALTFLNLTSAECIRQRWKKQPITSLNCMEPPAFGANLIFQLHEDDSFEHSVKVRYNGEYVFLCERKNTSCRYQELMNRIQQQYVDSKKICSTG